ncbi:hypothetical protein JTB14_024277 [Gonioctena quinquepunctata]|nr:hypothetical protein JTB14_024277 [Gonioctena quinquepunctata]
MKYKQLMDTVSISSLTDSSSITSTKHVIYEKDTSSSKADETECGEEFFKQYMEKAASSICISEELQLSLEIPKQCYFCINISSETTHCTPRNKMIALKKFACINLMPSLHWILV